ncbi:MAG: hypothetical protein GWN86_16130, partial [Desulfobacterales bacterium]|nr:hypothetical protein [Desulfobacterales bacterium]
NEMTVRAIKTFNQSFQVSGEGFTPTGKFYSNGEEVEPLKNSELELILKAGLLCNDSSIVDDEDVGPYIIGDPTEGA